MKDHLFPLLSVNDLLRLRRVCQPMKQLASSHLRVYHVDDFPELEISENFQSPCNLTTFLEMNLPSARIYINNQTLQFFSLPGIPEFLSEFSAKITHLRVRNCFAFSTEPEMAFYMHLINLKHLTLENIDATQYPCDVRSLKLPNGHVVPRPPCPVPSTFQHLKTLKFGHIEPSTKYDHGYWEDVVECCCEGVLFIGHPLYDHPRPPNHLLPLPPELQQLQMGISNNGSFQCISNVSDHRFKVHPDRPNLQFYDLANWRDTDQNGGSSVDYLIFASNCYKMGVKLLNVDAELYTGLGPCEGNDKHFIQTTYAVISLINVNRALFQRELPNLERVKITKTSCSTYYPLWIADNKDRPRWPRLKALDITVDSEELEELIGMNVGTQEVAELFGEFLFGEGMVREELEELRIGYDEEAAKREDLPCPRTADLRMSCANIKKLVLFNWVGTNKALSKLWSGLQVLNELTLENCRALGNVGFVGEDRENPTFLMMKSKITDNQCILLKSLIL